MTPLKSLALAALLALGTGFAVTPVSAKTLDSTGVSSSPTASLQLARGGLGGDRPDHRKIWEKLKEDKAKEKQKKAGA